MSRNLNHYSDMKGGMDRGPKKHESHIAVRAGDVMKVASTEVISTHPSNSIKNTAALMRDHDVRRLPVIHAGSGKLEGLVTAVDILDFLGGGPKYNILMKDYGGNFLSAVNCPISKIMRPAQWLKKSASVEDAVKIILERHSSCIPVVDDEERMDVVGLVTERDILPAPGELGVAVAKVMNRRPIAASPGMMMADVSKVMVRNQIRRLPVIAEGRLAGVVTAFDVLGYLGDGDYKGVDAEENLSTRVEEIMESNVLTVAPEDDLGKVVEIVRDTGYGGFPVTKGDIVVGIVTTTDVLWWVHGQR
jgi:CBS domain-containing protein